MSKIAGGVLIVIALASIAALLRAFAMMAIWNWLIVETMRAAPMTLPAAIGVSLFVAVALPQQDYSAAIEKFGEMDTFDRWGSVIGQLVGLSLGYVIMLAAGWLLHSYVSGGFLHQVFERL